MHKGDGRRAHSWIKLIVDGDETAQGSPQITKKIFYFWKSLVVKFNCWWRFKVAVQRCLIKLFPGNIKRLNVWIYCIGFDWLAVASLVLLKLNAENTIIKDNMNISLTGFYYLYVPKNLNVLAASLKHCGPSVPCSVALWALPCHFAHTHFFLICLSWMSSPAASLCLV